MTWVPPSAEDFRGQTFPNSCHLTLHFVAFTLHSAEMNQILIRFKPFPQ